MAKARLFRRGGFSLLNVAVALGLVSIAILIFTQVYRRFNFSRSRITRSVTGEEAMTLLATEIQNLPLGQIRRLCEKHNAFAGPVTGPCVSGGALANGLAAPKQGQPLLHTRLTFDRRLDSTGPLCVELSKCAWHGNKSVLEAIFIAHWKDPAPDKPLVSNAISIRRVRW